MPYPAGLPTFRLSPADALTCVSILRRVGDKASLDKRYIDAADYFLLATSTIFRSLPFASTAKSIRSVLRLPPPLSPSAPAAPDADLLLPPRSKAALCYLEAGEHERVETTMQLLPSGEEEAKDHFVRFCARLSNVAKGASSRFLLVVRLIFRH